MNLTSDHNEQQKQQENTSTSSDNSRNLKPFSCHICTFRACEKYNLLRHYDNKHSLRKRDVNIVYPCPVCDRTFKGKAYLITHLENHHDSISKPYRCSICKTSYDNVTDLERHHLSHEFDLTTDPGEEIQDDGKPKERTSLLQCQKCSLGFETLESLQRHQRRHIETIGTNTTVQTTTTTSTSQAFTFKPPSKKSNKNRGTKELKRKLVKEKDKTKVERRQDKAKVRRRLTNGPEFLDCPYCSSQFSNKNFNGITNLNIHLLLKHKNTIKSKPRTHLNKCPKCVKMFTSQASLDVHLQKRHGDTPEEKDVQNNRKPISPRKRKEISEKADSGVKQDPVEEQQTSTSSIKSETLSKGAVKSSSSNDRKARLRRRLARKRSQLKTKLITSRTRSQSPVKTTSSSSNENNVQKTSKLNRRRDNDAPNTSKSNSAFRKKGRPPGIGKVIAGRILKKYRCPHCHLTYIHLPSFNNHQQVCKSMKATALQLSNNKRLMKS